MPVTAPDPRRWLTLGFVIVVGTIVVIDTTVLNVSVPTIQRDLGASLTSVEWVLTGYSLTFASLLVIGGRLGDLFGARRLTIIGVGIFGVGSFIASISTNVGMLIVGEAVIEGIGGALLLPNTLAMLATNFHGHERGTAFAAWACALSSGSILGPVLGGYLTTYHSWRWAFRINVVAAPLVLVALLVFGGRDVRRDSRPRLDFPGALLVTLGAFLVVFGVSQGNTYGYLRAVAAFSIGGVDVWPASMGLSIVPVTVVVGLACVAAFVQIERAKERDGTDPLFAISKFRIPTFSASTVIGCSIAFSQVGTSFCLALYLQGSRHLTPVQNGLWVLPAGAGSVLGAPVGGWLVRRFEATRVFRAGLGIHAIGLVLEAILLPSGAPYALILPAFAIYGFGNGISMSQFNRLMLHDIDPADAGAATGMSSTIRQVAAAAGIAVSGAVFMAVTKHVSIDDAITPAMLVAATVLFIGLALALRLPTIGNMASPPGDGDGTIATVAEAVVASEAQLAGTTLTPADRTR